MIISDDLLNAFSLTSSHTVVLRDKERQQISSFLLHSLQPSTISGNCCFISGVPGTGKTSLVIEILDNLPSSQDSASFQTVFVNGADYTTANGLYATLYNKLSKKSVTAVHALKSLAAFLNKRKSVRSNPSRLVLVVDEVDYLQKIDSNIVFNFVDWSSIPLVTIIFIANTLAADAALLPRIESRIGPNWFKFKDYDSKEMKQILINRFKSGGVDDVSTVCDDSVLTFVVKKTCFSAGDCRRALALMKNTLMIARVLNVDKITIEHVNLALQQEKGGGLASLIDSLSDLERSVVEQLVSSKYAVSVDELIFSEISFTQLMVLLRRLELYGLVILSEWTVSLCVDRDDLLMCFKS
ncbi:hypothetical protein RCL1_002166 [Eukaryota sp. TZLM3-RCL]